MYRKDKYPSCLSEWAQTDWIYDGCKLVFGFIRLETFIASINLIIIIPPPGSSNQFHTPTALQYPHMLHITAPLHYILT